MKLRNALGALLISVSSCLHAGEAVLSWHTVRIDLSDNDSDELCQALSMNSQSTRKNFELSDNLYSRDDQFSLNAKVVSQPKGGHGYPPRYTTETYLTITKAIKTGETVGSEVTFRLKESTAKTLYTNLAIKEESSPNSASTMEKHLSLGSLTIHCTHSESTYYYSCHLKVQIPR